MEVLLYTEGSSWDACSGTPILTGAWISLWGGDPGNWFSVYPVSQFVTRPEATCYLGSLLHFRGLLFKQFPF